MVQCTVVLPDRNSASTEISLVSCHDQKHDKKDTCIYTIYQSVFKLDVYSINATNNLVYHSPSQRIVGYIIYNFRL
jgi:hypothetical protein